MADSSQNSKQKKPQKSRKLFAASILLLVLILAGGFIATKTGLFASQDAVPANQATLNAAGDLVIPVSGITAKATFYPVTVDGTALEVLAIKAPDGSIRTAFNTCQVCYASGLGYYKQEGDELVCQNCGNRFLASQVEVTKGGCNPVPIFSDQKTVDATNVTISGDYLKAATVIFQNWERT